MRKKAAIILGMAALTAPIWATPANASSPSVIVTPPSPSCEYQVEGSLLEQVAFVNGKKTVIAVEATAPNVRESRGVAAVRSRPSCPDSLTATRNGREPQ